MKRIIFYFFLFLMSGSFFVHGLEVDKPIIKIEVVGGSVVKEAVVLLGVSGEDVRIDKSMNGFFTVSDEVLHLNDNGEGYFDIVMESDLRQGVYVGSIRISSMSDGEIVIPVVSVVENKDKRFDVAIELSQESLFVSPEENIIADYRLFNLGSVQSSLFLVYKLVDLNGEGVFYNEEIIDVENKLTLRKVLQFGEIDLEPGKYVLTAEVSQAGLTGADAVFVEVTGVPLASPPLSDFSVIFVYGIAVFLILFVFVISFYWRRRVLFEAKNWKGHVRELKRVKFSDAARYIRKLERQKIVLEAAYRNKYISKSSYLQGVLEINRLINKAKKRL